MIVPIVRVLNILFTMEISVWNRPVYCRKSQNTSNATRLLRLCYRRLSRLMKPNLVKNTTGAP